MVIKISSQPLINLNIRVGSVRVKLKNLHQKKLPNIKSFTLLKISKISSFDYNSKQLLIKL